MSLRSTSIPQGRPRSESLPPSAQRLFEEIAHQLPYISTYTELVFENVKPDDGSLVCRSLDGHAETERRGARINYNSVTRVLRLKFMPISLHDVHQRWINTSIVEWRYRDLLTEQESDLLWSGVGTTFDQFSGMYSGSSKQPDHYLRVDTDPSPQIVVESGWSESFPHLRNDKDLWMLGDPSVVLVILLRWTTISNGRIKGCAEVWRRDTVGRLISSTLDIFPAPSPSPPTEMIQFTKRELFGAAMTPGANPDTVFELDVAKLRQFAEEVITKMNMQPA
ncbi:hypothetical protein P168DRAFT_296403 [Aspergillus campestris IBT 28561]|uniref:Uncharacterized protein n=1 Tax=Aspergillus campestris (strain IBT 28561) TaxID=1392248 RepID=A0A2I1D3Z6_ASPC2|nr:uncharacterized protein P168DRAFT_296403 [Aspergillus campestris IBT 28561]PKY04602.1 hypothetical protein P168DRAFT_296403 [Aspergillus campestris IBT 28561]